MIARKSQGISIQVLIIAAVSLVVLIVLVAIFTGRINVFSKTYQESTEESKSRVCITRGGKCVTGTNCGALNIMDDKPQGWWIDCGDDQVCCRIS